MKIIINTSIISLTRNNIKAKFVIAMKVDAVSNG